MLYLERLRMSNASNANRVLRLQTLMSISNLSAMLTGLYKEEAPVVKPDTDMPLTNDEYEKLDSLYGKEKRNYVRELRNKYGII